jgi:hypothetical protein
MNERHLAPSRKTQLTSRVLSVGSPVMTGHIIIVHCRV